MEITTSVTVSDYVYRFYQKAAQEIGDTTPEELMSSALFMYAGIVATDILNKENGDTLSL